MDLCSSSSEDEDLEMTVVLASILRRRNRRRRKRKMWVRPIFARRRQQGEYHNLLQELRLSDPESHFTYMRMTKETFNFLLGKVRSKFVQKVFELGF